MESTPHPRQRRRGWIVSMLAEDYLHVRGLLRQAGLDCDERAATVLLSNNRNVVLAALQDAAELAACRAECERLREALSNGLDLCVRARKLDAMDRREATLAASSNPDEWQASGRFDTYVERHNRVRPDQPIATRSGTIALWVQEQYETDLADWERTARAALRTPRADEEAAGG